MVFGRKLYNDIVIFQSCVWMLGAMRGKYCYAIMIFFTFCLLSVLVIESHNVRAIDNVENEVLLAFDNGVFLQVSLTTRVYEITLPANGMIYTSSEIQSISSSNPEMMGAIKISVKGLNSDQLQESFPLATITSLQELPVYSQGVFTDEYEIFLSSDFFMVNTSINIEDLIIGLLDSGAAVNYSFPLQSYRGWNHTYHFELPTFLTYKVTNGNVKQNIITWHVQTMGESSVKQAEMNLNYKDPTTSHSKDTSLDIGFIINSTQPEKPILSIAYAAKKISLNSSNILPSFISNVEALPADAIRLCILNNLIDWNAIQNQTLIPIHEQVTALIESSSFNQTIDTIFSWKNETTTECNEPYNTSNMDSMPPITGMFEDSDIHFTICNISSRAVYGLTNAGATVSIENTDVNFGDNFQTLSYPYNGTLLLPKNVLLDNKNIVSWNQDTLLNGTFSSKNAPSYSNQDINSSFLIDIESTDLNLLSFFTGKTELTMGMFLQEKQERNVTLIPSEFSIPPKIALLLYNADVFRLCVEEQVFTNDQITSFLSNSAVQFKNRSSALFPKIKGEARTKRSLFDASLNWDKDISTMQSDNPILVSSSMHTAYPLSFHFSIIPPTFTVVPQNLTFEAIPNQNVTYTMVFPKGISIDYNDSLDRAFFGITPDGRSYLEVSFNASEGNLVNNVVCYIYPSSLFILGLFVPCIVSIFITILLFIVVYILRNKRKNMKYEPKEHHTPYEEEEYYVPPPPTKRK